MHSCCLALCFFLTSFSLSAQECLVLENAEVGISLISSDGGTANRSAVAFNPNAELYYSVNAGSTVYPIDTYSIIGTRVNARPQGFDYRGAWWNPNTNVRGKWL